MINSLSQFGAGAAVKRRQADAREKVADGHADFRVGRADLLLRRANVGPPLQQGRGQADRDFHRHLLRQQG